MGIRPSRFGVAILVTGLLAGCDGTRGSAEIAAVGHRDSQYCAPGARAASVVVERACRDVGELVRAGVSETEVTSAVRQWVAGWVDFDGGNPPGQATSAPDAYWTVALDDHFRALARDEYGLLCGGTAWILMKVYEVLGLESYIYDFGDDSGRGVSHVVTLVRADGRLIVQDAYTNYTLTEVSGEPIDVRDALRLIASSREHEVVVKTLPISKQVLVPAADREELDEILARGDVWNLSEFAGRCTLLPGSVARCVADNVDASFIRKWVLWPLLQKMVRARGLAPEATSLMLFPLGVSSTVDGWTPPDDARATRTNTVMRSLVEAMGGRGLEPLH